MIQTVENKEEIIKNSVNHIWKATEGKVATITFDDPLNSATITLNNGNKTILNLDVPGVVLVNEEIFRKIVNVVDRSNRKEPIIIDEVEIRLQESATQSSSFEIEEDCTNKKSSPLDDSEASVDQPLNYKESDDNAIEKNRGNEIQGLNSSIQEYDNPQSDEYYDSIEEADEQRFNEITSRLTKSNSGDKYKFQINNQFKASKNKIEKNNSKIGKVDKKPSVTQSSHPSKETNLSHSKIVDTETSVEGSNRNDVLAISSIINGQESSTPPLNITKKNSSDVCINALSDNESTFSIVNLAKQSSDSFPTATATNNTEFLRGNNRKEKQRMQYSPTETDLDGMLVDIFFKHAYSKLQIDITSKTIRA
ncbi:7646_t:CDS:2 [Racocetra fulgida]|uniref:7646_t:CDS:1 n=1 Tax=Racocetra fulgida TaxID=60492 RepID=A0A9N9B118_9GLOM|nr:7646_t:CDS:2 [Racocetra fulgida]